MKKVWLFLGLAAVGIAAGIGAVMILSSLQSHEIGETVAEVRGMTTISEIGGRAVATGGDFEETNPYWQFVKMNLISVDFDRLLERNPDTVGWVEVAGTELNLPFTQTTNNNYYTVHDFNRKRNNNGWIFLDHRNANDLSDRNSVIYLKNGLAADFGQILYNGWLSDRANFIVKTATTDAGSGNWQIFAVFETKDEYAAQVKFSSEEEFGTWLDNCASWSRYDFNVTTTPNDKILTLVDAREDGEKVVVMAKLIKKS